MFCIVVERSDFISEDSAMKLIKSSEPIEVFNLSVRLYNLLKRASINSTGDLFFAMQNGFKNIRGLGGKLSIDLINTLNGYKLIEHGEGEEISIQDFVNNQSPVEDMNDFVKEKFEAIYDAIEELITQQIETLSKQVEIGLLHKKTIISGKTLEYYLQTKEINLTNLSRIFSKIISSLCITEELAYLTSNFSARDFDIIIARYGFSKRKYEEIGIEFGVTRERIRQILNRLERRIANKAKCSLRKEFGLFTHALIRMQTALYCGEQQGLEITYDAWVQSLRLSGLLGNWNIGDDFSHDPIELFISICNLLSHEGIHEFSLPDNLKYAIELLTDELPGVSVKYLHIIRNLPSEICNEIKRHTCFSGGVQARWLSEEINLEPKRTEDILQALGYIKVNGDWYIPGKVEIKKELSKKDVLEHSIRKMTQYCGSLSVESICSGIRHAISRTRYPTPTPAVLREILKNHGYSTEGNMYYWDGNVDERLSRGEGIIFECFKKNGPVIHHAEIAQAFIDSELAFPSIHQTLKRSPLIEKIDIGLYKIRGRTVSTDDIERASSAGDRIPMNLMVDYDRTGRIKVSISLGIIVVGTGVIFSANLPNLVGAWKCVVGEEKFREIIVTENEIRGLLKPISLLKCEVADRICLTFDTWSRTVILEKVNNETNRLT